MTDQVFIRPEDNLSRPSAEGLDPACFHVVAIGASAGGLESLEQFFKTMPPNSGMAFVVLQHLSPDFRSLMDELLARHTSMRICKAEDDMQVEPNTIYLNPPRKNMIISGGSLFLSDLDSNETLTLPIDQFFRSLAQDYRRQAIAVVLSGTGSDGSRGIRDVYEAGGLVVCETEETAKFDGMPRSAQETGCVHLVLPPDAMPDALVSYVNQALSPQDFAEKVFVPPRLGGMETLFRLIRDEYGIDFSYYKPNTVVRRIERRISLNHSGTIEEYAEQLKKDHGELNALYRDLLIGVTRFFRDRDAFDFLKSDVLPELIGGKEEDEELRIWVAGCATGEEAYSIGILVDEALQNAGKKLDVKIFATDIHPVSLEFAAAGIYSEEAFGQVDKRRLDQYFRPVQDGYQVQNRLRQMVVFAQHNVFKDAPFTKLDLISCRNLLIYLQPLAQRKALSLFHFGLRTGGILVLGPSESPGEFKDEFETRNNRWKVYRKTRDVRLPTDMRLPLATGGGGMPRAMAPVAQPPSAPHRHLLTAYDKLLERHLTAAFLVDDSRNLLHVFGSAKQYLEPYSGRVSLDLLDVVRPDLKAILASALQRVRRIDETLVTTTVQLGSDQAAKNVTIHVSKLAEETNKQFWFLVSLTERPSESSDKAPSSEISPAEFSSDRVRDLEFELRYTKESLQSTVEELETSNEELQATNEELVASNEELQSTNEELHSVNEELYTVNAEYQNKIAELTELTADMDNLLESTEIGTIFLDDRLTIRKYTGKVESWFELVPRDIGRKISAFSNNLNHPELIEDVRAVLQENQPVEREIRDQAGKWLHLRLHPYRREGVATGVVMTLIDISNLKQTRAKLQQLSAIVESCDDAIIGKNFNGRIESWNQGAERMFSYTAEEAIGSDVSLILPPHASDEARQYFDQLRRGESVKPIEVQRRTKSGETIDTEVRFSPIRDWSGVVTGMSAICRDITAQKVAQRELQKLALVVRHTDNAVVITDREGLAEWVNEGFTRITGYQSAEVRGRKPGHVLQGPESSQETISLMRERIARGEPFNVEIINYHKNGEKYWIAIEARPLVDESNNISGFMAIQRDVTELKRAQANAREEVARRDEFLAMLSHELRNPLGALTNGLEFLRGAPVVGPEQRKEVEDVLRAQVSQMCRLLDDLLDVSRIARDKILIRKEVIDLRKPAQDAVAAVTQFTKHRECPILLDLPEEPVAVKGDAARLQQVQVNLLTNAIKHSRPGDPIRLSVERDGAQAVIRVLDVGDGINPEVQSKVFDLFFQTDSEVSRTKGGLGVGLSLVRELVAAHGGEVAVHSKGLGKGSEFVIKLPLEQEIPQDDCSPHASNGRSLRIVIVEDELANRTMLKQMLELSGHHVQVAANGAQGIDLIRSEQPELALVDIGLPDFPGYEIAQTLRSTKSVPGTFLTALTGYGQYSDIEQAKAAGFDMHVVKPLNTEKLDKILTAARADRGGADTAKLSNEAPGRS